MLDVVLYGHDRRGTLHLRERAFRSLRGLASYFASQERIPWEWAEVTGLGRDGRLRVVRYSAQTLRVMALAPHLVPSLN